LDDLDDIFMSQQDLERIPHDKFFTFPIPKTPKENSEYIPLLVSESDIILELLDARDIIHSRNIPIEKLINNYENKILIYTITKSDLVSNEYLETQQYNSKKKPKEINEDNYLDIFNSMQEYLKKENKKEIHKETKESPFNKIKIKNERDIIDRNGFMDPFKYNPNYNAISKNVPSVKMMLTEKEKREMKKNQENKSRTKNIKLVHSKTESGDKKK